MGSGFRDSFADNIDDEFGSIYDSDPSMANLPAKARKRKSKSSRTKASRKKKSRSPRRSRSRTPRKSKSGRKRKGMSKEFLRNLRKKHHLGEFKRR